MWIVNKYNPYKYIPNGGYSVGMYQEPGSGRNFWSVNRPI